ncbi:MAG: FAD binding domain-containing protein [Spirochaetales bacterium]|jgi:xanthine dehydrogenase FAD-binding subunit|nr:FAD binding domain-containing protein [Spirochaetales bacterium]
MVDAFRPETLQEALLIREKKGAVPFLGGTDLMVRYRSPAGVLPQFPWPILYLSQLKELHVLEEHTDILKIGAGVTLTEMEHSALVPSLLRTAVSQMAAPALRNIGTLAGNICNASPAGDTICALYVLEASVELVSAASSRILPIEEFISGPGKTVLSPDEILVSVRIPIKSFTTAYYRKVGTRRANALSKLSFCGLAEVKNGRIDDLRIAFGAVGPTVVRSAETEKKLIGCARTDIDAAADQIYEDYTALIQPIDDQRSTAVYRKQVALNLLRQFTLQLIKEIQ